MEVIPAEEHHGPAVHREKILMVGVEFDEVALPQADRSSR